MKKSILSLGISLDKTEQKNINGGFGLCTYEICEEQRKGHLFFDPGCDCHGVLQ